MTSNTEHPLLDVLRKEAASFGPKLSRTAFERGLAVTRPEGQRPIPITATPEIVDSSVLAERVSLAASVAQAVHKAVGAVLRGPSRELLLGALSPLERRVAEKTFAQVTHLATTRTDFFVADRTWALELNATIPAMQGYSDIAAKSFIEAIAELAGVPHAAANWVAQNGSNARALHQALVTGYTLERGRAPHSVALLTRRNDAQLTELLYLAKAFTELGTEAAVVYPDELSGEERVVARGREYDLVYRHLFIRRLEEHPSPYVEDLLLTTPGRKAVLLNPPASQYEVKSAFALLSEAVVNPKLAAELGLEDSELSALSKCVPWTRNFLAPSSELMAQVVAEPSRYVLKRSWDYGGKAVFLGNSVQDASFQDRARATFGAELTWPELCAKAAADRRGGGFIVQEAVEARAQPHILCTEQTVQPVELFVDFSCYASVGLGMQPAWGGVCRGSISRVVNIVGGGGVVPLVTRTVADALLAALKKRG